MSHSANGTRVSVIIPSYESQATVRATLQSLRRQTLRDFETILIDSGHTGEVAQIASEFQEIVYHRSKRRLLPHEARNIGAGMAHSDVLGFTAPGVVAAPEWLGEIIA